MTKLTANETILLKRIETFIWEYRTSIDKRVRNPELGLTELDVFLTKQRAAREACDDILRGLKNFYNEQVLK